MGIVSRVGNLFGLVGKTEVLELVEKTKREVSGNVSTKWRQHRRFEGARINRLSADAPISANHINEDVRLEAPILIARARWMAQNDAYIRRGLTLIVNNVIGSGGIQIAPKIPKGGNTPGAGGNFDVELNKAVKQAYKTWGRKGSCERRNLYNIRTFDRGRLRAKIRDGESFVFRTTGRPTAENPFGYWVDLVDPLRIPHDMNQPSPTKNGNHVFMGIEVDDNGIAVAYYMRAPLGWTIFDTYATKKGGKVIRVPASQMIHDFDPEYAEQIRGFSGIPGAMRRAPMLDGFSEATLVAARNSASTMGWYVENGESESDYTGDFDDEDDEDEDFIEELEPGMMRKMPKGWTAEMHNPTQPTQQYGDFVKAIVRYMAADLNVSYHAMAQDLENVNLSSIRHGTQEDREQYKNLQQDEICTFHEPIYKEWIILALGLGQIKFGNGRVMKLTDANLERLSLTNVGFKPRGWEFPEPYKDAQAHALRIRTGTSAPQDVVEAEGRDWDEHLERLATNKTQLEALGLDIAAGNITIVNEAEPAEEG